VIVLPEALALHLPRLVELRARGSAAGAIGAGRQLLERHRRHLDVQINVIRLLPPGSPLAANG
jgi:hypothetical protein